MNRQVYDNYVKYVEKNGSLTKAAKELGISQPALSQGLTALEKEVGFKIFNRRANPITFTSEGEMYYEHLCRIDTLNANFDKKLYAFRDNVNNKVIIGAPAVYVNSVVVPAVMELLEEDPSFDITIKTGSLEELVTLAMNGEIDVFISTSNNVPDEFITDKIYKENIVFCTPINSALNDISCINSERLICLEDTFPLQVEVNQYLKKNKIFVKKHLIVDQVSLAVDLVEKGLGVCFASMEATRDRQIKTIDTGILGRDIFISYDSELFRTKACEALINKIRSN